MRGPRYHTERQVESERPSEPERDPFVRSGALFAEKKAASEMVSRTGLRLSRPAVYLYLTFISLARAFVIISVAFAV